MSFSLPFVSLERINEAVDLMIREYASIDDEMINDWCDKFINQYIVQYWIEGLQPESWNVAEYGEENLTNNAAEGGNHPLSVRLGTQYTY